MQYQTKRIVVPFGDGSFSSATPGKLPANSRDIRKALKLKSKELGCFPDDFPIQELRGKRRLVVLDIHEFKTSVNLADATLTYESEGSQAMHVRGIYSVVVSPNGTSLS